MYIKVIYLFILIIIFHPSVYSQKDEKSIVLLESGIEIIFEKNIILDPLCG